MLKTCDAKILRIVLFSFYLLTPSWISCITYGESSVLSFPVYNFQATVPRDEGKQVYWKNLDTAFQKNPEAIKAALLISHFRNTYSQRVFTDNHGRRYMWDDRNGLILLPAEYQNYDYQYHSFAMIPHYAVPVFWAKTPHGWLPLTTNPFVSSFSSVSLSTNINDYWCDPTKSDLNSLVPKLSSDEGTIDPCAAPQLPKEFGLTASSSMADILCFLCQMIKSLQCVWQFCSHPDGVYKIQYKKIGSLT